MVLIGESVFFYRRVLKGESVEYVRNGTDRGKCGVFKEWY